MGWLERAPTLMRAGPLLGVKLGAPLLMLWILLAPLAALAAGRCGERLYLFAQVGSAIRYTFDERINDGLYSYFTLAGIRERLENPEMLVKTQGEPV